MNKTLLFLSALALCGSSMPAQTFEFSPLSPVAPAKMSAVQAKADASSGSMEFRYYQDGAVNGLTAGSSLYSGEVWETVCMPKETAAMFAGNKISSINVTTPVNARSTSNKNYVVDVTVFLSKSRLTTPFYTQTASLGSVSETKVNIPLETAYEITGEEDIWFGYYFTLTRNIASNNYYVPIDMVPPATNDGSWVKLGGQWQSVAEYGSLLIGAVIEGDKLPTNAASIYGISGSNWVEQGETYSFVVGLKNGGVNDITSVELEYAFNGGQAESVSHTFETPLTSNSIGLVNAEFACDAAGSQLPLEVKLTKVNGEAVDVAGMTKNIDCYKPGTVFKRNVLIEEATGTWCPNCPLGLVALESIKETYTDGSVVLVGVHQGDAMQTSTYSQFLSWAFTGYPQYQANRKTLMGFYGDNAYNLEKFGEVYNEITSEPAKAKIDLSLEWTSENRTSIHAKTSSIFSNASEGTYKVAFIVVEDGVGPYDQSNNLTGTPGFGEFSTGGSLVSWTYNEVARDIFSAFGLTDSAITDPEAMTRYNYEYEVSLANVTNIEKARIVAALLDNATREVVNVVEVPLSNASGVSNIADDTTQVSVRAEMGAVVVNGAAVTEVYAVDGRRAATAYGEATINLPAGLYIVKADKLVKKVVVK